MGFVLIKESIIFYNVRAHTYSWRIVAYNVTLINMKGTYTFVMMFTRYDQLFINLVMAAANWEGKSAENSVTLFFDLLLLSLLLLYKRKRKISVWWGWIEHYKWKKETCTYCGGRYGCSVLFDYIKVTMNLSSCAASDGWSLPDRIYKKANKSWWIIWLLYFYEMRHVCTYILLYSILLTFYWYH